MSAPIALGVFAVVLATLGPALLRRSAWPDRSPRLGILAWQAVTGSVVLAVVLAGAALALPAVPLTANLADLLSACAMALRAQYSTPGGAAVSATGAILVVTVLARAGHCLTAGLVMAARQRRQQLQALALGAHRGDCGALIVDSPAVAAYCLPGRRREVVLTTAALDALDDGQLAAVLAHERAHLRARHDLVLAAAAALQRAFPRVPVFRDAHRELVRLVEMAADDAAAQGEDRLTVATALVRLAEASAPASALGAGGSTSLTRVLRLLAPAQPLGAAHLAVALLAVGGLLAVPVAIVTAPAVVAATADLCPLDWPQQPVL